MPFKKSPSSGDALLEKPALRDGQEALQKEETRQDLIQLQEKLVLPGNRNRSNELWGESLGSQWKSIDKLDLKEAEKIILVTHPLWGFLSQKTYQANPSHITSRWFDYIEGRENADVTTEFKKFLTQYVSHAAKQKHISVKDRLNVFYILENLHLAQELSKKQNPKYSHVFVLPLYEGGKNTPSRKEYRQYTELLTALFGGVQNKYFTSSTGWEKGYLYEEDAKKLGKFSIEKTITSVGGYVGRCLSNTWRSFDQHNTGEFKMDLDTILPVHSSVDIGSIEMRFNDALWNMLFNDIRNNPNFSFEDILAITQGDLWEKLSYSLDEKSLKKTDSRRQGPNDIKTLIQGGRIQNPPR